MKLITLILLCLSTHADDITYTKDIKPIFQNRCSSCHNSGWPDHNWLDYNIAYNNKDKIKDRVWVKKNMPMSNTGITDDERNMIKDWVDGGGKK